MIFERSSTEPTQTARRLHARFELAYTIVDFLAAALFVLGSIFFFYDSLTFAGTWLFLIGSLMFGAKPTLRLIREVKLAKLGETEKLAQKYED